MTLRSRHRGPKGLAIIPVLVCLVLATSICGSLLKQALAQRALVHSEERTAQADWLAESGLARASARLSAPGNYQGETWEIPASALGGRSTAVVSIAVTPVENKPGQRFVRVRADYPRNDEQRVRITKTTIVHLATEPSGEAR
jgi:hypothetical protein